MSSRLQRSVVPACLFLCGLGLALPAFSQGRGAGEAPSFKLGFDVASQGPPWPPSEIVDQDGNFLVVNGFILPEVAPGQVVPIIGSALVSKNTVPPLDANGREDFSNPFGAPYDVIRPLDLAPGSPDLDIVLYADSYGPAVGDFGGGPRIPREGESPYNLNMLAPTCPEIFPSESQKTTYTLPRRPLHMAPIWNFLGDQAVRDADTGATTAQAEQTVMFRRAKPITLGDYMKQKGEVKVTLTRFDRTAGSYTHARFDFRFSGLLPNSVYTIWAVREISLVLGLPPSPLALPNVFTVDESGEIRFSREVRNPFPDPNGPDSLERLVAIGWALHPDYQNWGGCFGRLGAGVDISGGLLASNGGTFHLTDLITVEPAN